jgi:hypothetical protein
VAETSPSSVKEKPAMILNRDDKTSEDVVFASKEVKKKGRRRRKQKRENERRRECSLSSHASLELF